MRSDRGSHFVNKAVEEFCRLFEIQLVLTLPEQPQANAIVDTNGGEVTRRLRVWSQQGVYEWLLDETPLYLVKEQEALQLWHASIIPAEFEVGVGIVLGSAPVELICQMGGFVP